MAKRSISAFIQDALMKRKSAHKEALAVLEAALFSFHPNQKYTYKISITSLWADTGEKSISLTKKGSLEKVFAFAAHKFKEVNRRGDIQARWQVIVVLSPECEIALSRDFWGHLEEKYKGPVELPKDYFKNLEAPYQVT